MNTYLRFIAFYVKLRSIGFLIGVWQISINENPIASAYAFSYLERQEAFFHGLLLLI